MNVQKSIMFALFALFALSCAGCGGMRTMSKDVSSAVTIDELQNNGDKYASRLTQQAQELIIAIKKGDSVPIELVLDAPQIATLELGQNRLKFTQDIFLAIGGSGVFLSKDGVKWARLGDEKALKELFGFTKGSFQAGFAATKEKGAFISLGLSLK